MDNEEIRKKFIAKYDEILRFSKTAKIVDRFKNFGIPKGDPRLRKINFKYPNAKRNEPCPCGSGRKFKKCCFGKLDGE